MLNYSEFGPVVQKEMLFKDILYLELWMPFCLTEQSNLCIFCRSHYQEQFCKIILNLDQWFRRRCRSKTFLSRALEALMFRGALLFMQYW